MSSINEKPILVTAFEPFGGDALNPTQLVLERLPEEVCTTVTSTAPSSAASSGICT